MKLSLLNIRVAMFGALFLLACSFLNSVQSHHIRGIPGGTGYSSDDPCGCYDDENQDRHGGGGESSKAYVYDDDDPCYCYYHDDDPSCDYDRDAKNNTCPVNPSTGKLKCLNDNLRCPGNQERCCLFNGICGCPDPCDASRCRAVGSTSLEVHGVSVATMSSIRILGWEAGLKCDPLSNRLMCCKDSVCSHLPEVVVSPQTINTFNSAICDPAGKRILQFYANVTEVIFFWAFGRERYGKESDGGFGDLVGEVIEKLLGRTPNNLNLPFSF